MMIVASTLNEISKFYCVWASISKRILSINITPSCSQRVDFIDKESNSALQYSNNNWL